MSYHSPVSSIPEHVRPGYSTYNQEYSHNTYRYSATHPIMQVSQPPQPHRPLLWIWERENCDYYLPHHQPRFTILRDRFPDLLKKREEQGLNSLSPAVTGHGHPTASFESILKAAILGSPESKLSVKELCAVIPRRYTYYTNLGNDEVRTVLPGPPILSRIF
ncbi:hypothetical protein JB92DRAFT_1263622 [Gautieria morchelliformis]|nr:hypothetical protein JB92DRAFT_1263622 [Gautieria morchelliformis]